MVHAKSLTLKQLEARRLHNEAVDLATLRYRQEQSRPLAPREKRLGVRPITLAVHAEYKRAGTPVKFVPQTVLNRVHNMKNMTEAMEPFRHLTAQQDQALVDFIISYAQWGWPATGRLILQLANQLREKSGKTPITGGHWVERWVAAHPVIHAYRPKAHDSQRGRAANPTNVNTWFQLLGDVVVARRSFEEFPDLDSPVDADCIYGMDESGFQPSGCSAGEKVYGRSGQKQQYEQREGSRETITVLACICANGTSLPPAVIYKGEDFQVQWNQENPLDASLGYSKKGYVTGEISEAYIQHFDAQTRKKAAGRYRVLLVDGHVSHYSLKFIQEARQRRIILLCYPSHMTHILQGLDVVIFSVLKRAWEKARKEYEAWTGSAVNKQTFLGVLAVAWISVMTAELIQAAFAKTGVFPFDSTIVTADKLSTSMATTTELSNMMPLAPTTPVRHLTNRIRTAITDSNLPPLPACFNIDELMVDDENTSFGMANEVLQTSATFLLDPNQLDTSSTLRSFDYIPPPTPSRTPLTSTATQQFNCQCFEEDDEGNVKLLDRISQLEIENQLLRRDIRSLHSNLALTTIFCERIRTQSEAAKIKSASKKGRKRLNTTKGALLTGNEFILEVEEHETEKQRKADDKVVKGRKLADYKRAKELWDATDKARKARNNSLQNDLKVAVAKWEEDGRQGTKPKQTSVLDTKAAPKPPHPYPKRKTTEKEQEPEAGEPMQVDGDGEESDGESNASSDDD